MSNQGKASVWGSGLMYGAIAGCILIVISMVAYLVGQEGNQIIQFIGFPLFIAVLVWSVYGHKAKQGGFISYWQGVGVGVTAGVVTGIITGVFIIIYANFISSDFIAQILQKSEMDMIQQGYSDDKIEMGMAYVKMIVNPIAFAILSLITYGFMGLFISLITAAIFKKIKPEELIAQEANIEEA